jgi:hypothetical protein
MPSATFRCYEELNDLLAPERRKVPFELPFEAGATVGQLLEILKIPTSDVDLVLANGASVGLSYVVLDGDRISVYPVFESMDISTVGKVHPRPLRRPRFAVVAALSGLAARLRMLGFDVLCGEEGRIDHLIEIAEVERRALLTNDRRHLTDPAITRGYCVTGATLDDQVGEVVRRFDLTGADESHRSIA